MARAVMLSIILDPDQCVTRSPGMAVATHRRSVPVVVLKMEMQVASGWIYVLFTSCLAWAVSSREIVIS